MQHFTSPPRHRPDRLRSPPHAPARPDKKRTQALEHLFSNMQIDDRDAAAAAAAAAATAASVRRRLLEEVEVE